MCVVLASPLSRPRCFRGVSCARLASATAPASRSRKKEPAGDTDVPIGNEVAVGTLVACDSANQALTCHSTSDPFVLAANRAAVNVSFALAGTDE